MHGKLQLWLATPEAAQHFDPAQLTEPDRVRMVRLRRAAKRHEFAVSRALRAHVRCQATQPASESLGHSGGYAALAQTPAALRIGVDLEVHRPRDVLATARNAFSETEAHALEGANSPDRERLFYAMWTVKETLAKALQLHLLEALKSCVLVIDGPAWQVRVPTTSAGCVAVYQPRADLTLAVAAIGATPAIECWSWPPQLPASWPLIAAISLGAADAPAATDRGSAGAARAAAPA
jgi:hypothetical protein